MAKLREDEVMAVRVLHRKGETGCGIARRMGVTEGAVRYRLRREAAGARDGREKTRLIEELNLAEAVARWWEDYVAVLPDGRPPCVKTLFDWLQREHRYTGEYKSVLRYVRGRFPAPALRPFRRIETPAGAQSQSDWAERWVDIGEINGPMLLYAFVMVLSHSRKKAVIWSRSTAQVAWHEVHNQAYQRLGGVAAVNRIDNLKTGMAEGAGPWGRINPAYHAYGRQMRFHIDATEPRQPQEKGKVERAVQVIDGLGLEGKRFEGLASLQAWTDARMHDDSQKRICPATGKTVYESWVAEQPILGPLPATMPEPFDLVKTPKVYKDCTIKFEGRTYAVPFAYMEKQVEARGCASHVVILDPETGRELVRYPRHTAERILIDPKVYEGESTERVMAPKPLGKMARRLAEIAAQPVEARPVDLYAALAEVAR